MNKDVEKLKTYFLENIPEKVDKSEKDSNFRSYPEINKPMLIKG